MITKFVYTVSITDSSEFLKAPSVKHFFPKSNGMIITSMPFDNFEACEKNLIELLSKMAAEMAIINGNNYIIATVPNPVLDAESDELGWTDSILIKAYIADATALKMSTIISTVVGEIQVTDTDSTAYN